MHQDESVNPTRQLRLWEATTERLRAVPQMSDCHRDAVGIAFLVDREARFQQSIAFLSMVDIPVTKNGCHWRGRNRPTYLVREHKLTANGRFSTHWQRDFAVRPDISGQWLRRPGVLGSLIARKAGELTWKEEKETVDKVTTAFMVFMVDGEPTYRLPLWVSRPKRFKPSEMETYNYIKDTDSDPFEVLLTEGPVEPSTVIVKFRRSFSLDEWRPATHHEQAMELDHPLFPAVNALHALLTDQACERFNHFRFSKRAGAAIVGNTELSTWFPKRFAAFHGCEDFSVACSELYRELRGLLSNEFIRLWFEYLNQGAPILSQVSGQFVGTELSLANESGAYALIRVNGQVHRQELPAGARLLKVVDEPVEIGERIAFGHKASSRIVTATQAEEILDGQSEWFKASYFQSQCVLRQRGNSDYHVMVPVDFFAETPNVPLFFDTQVVQGFRDEKVAICPPIVLPSWDAFEVPVGGDLRLNFVPTDARFSSHEILSRNRRRPSSVDTVAAK